VFVGGVFFFFSTKEKSSPYYPQKKKMDWCEKLDKKRKGSTMAKKKYSRYTKELKAAIIAEYAKDEIGYHLIAKKFGMTRDAVRGIIKGSRNAKKTNVDNEVDVERMKNLSLENPKIDLKKLDKDARDYIEDLEAGLSFFRNYSELLEETYLKDVIKKDKKK